MPGAIESRVSNLGSGGASGPTIGSVVSGGGANQVLYEDGSQKLAASSLFQYFAAGTGPYAATPELDLGNLTTVTDLEVHLQTVATGRGILSFNMGASQGVSIDVNAGSNGLFKINNIINNDTAISFPFTGIPAVTMAYGVLSTSYSCKETGANDASGSGTLVGGTATISTTKCATTSRVFVQDTSPSLTNVGSLTVVAGNGSFVVTSTNILDTSTFNWFIVTPY